MNWLTEAQWCSMFFYARDVQSVGLSLFAFLICPYSRTELKVSAFFLVLWRVLVFGINLFDVGQGYTAFTLSSMSAIYIVWFLKSWLMGEYGNSKKQPGMYKIFFPIHSIWGLLQAVFLPWHPARYESRMISDGEYVWCVNNRKFSKYETGIIKNLDHVKVYMGRDMKATERAILNGMVGSKAMPPFRDCRKLMVV